MVLNFTIFLLGLTPTLYIEKLKTCQNLDKCSAFLGQSIRLFKARTINLLWQSALIYLFSWGRWGGKDVDTYSLIHSSEANQYASWLLTRDVRKLSYCKLLNYNFIYILNEKGPQHFSTTSSTSILRYSGGTLKCREMICTVS